MRMTCSLMSSWNEVVLISTKCQGRGDEKSKEKNVKKKRAQGGEKFNLVAFYVELLSP